MKAMRTAVLWLAAGLVGGFALSALLSEPLPSLQNEVTGIPDDTALVRRIAALEARLEGVTATTAALNERLSALDIMPTDGAAEAVPEADERRADRERSLSVALTGDELPANLAERIAQGRGRRGEPFNLVDRLTGAGFSQTDAQHIETRIEELRVEAMQSRYEALRSGEPTSAAAGLGDSSTALRGELGDSDYERYLEAIGRPTRVGVTSVLSSSAAQTAGIQTGDEIVSYGGERVFDTRDLNALLLEGEPGEPVIVDVVRDGQPIQLVIPRGPLGITSGFARPVGR